MASSRNSDSSWVPIAGTVLDERYRLGDVVDKGGMGVIMRAQHLVMQREVAVKVLRPEVAGDGMAMARFRREVGVAAKLEHPNIVRCHDSGVTPDGGMYLVMELLDGESLKDLLAREGRMELRRSARIALQMLDGLAAAHLQGVAHRDIKPGNIFVARDARGSEVVKILDFGLARSVFSEDMKVTQTGKICGTTAYLPPETIVSPDPTAAGDVYACGLVMLEMLLGRKVFDSRDIGQSFLQHLTVAAPIPARIWSSSYGPLLAEALRKHPDERPQSANELYHRLEEVLPTLPDVTLRDDEIPTRPGPLDGEVLQEIAGAGGLEMLKRLPEPICWSGDVAPTGWQGAPSPAPYVAPSDATRGLSPHVPEVNLPTSSDDVPLELDMSVLPAPSGVLPIPSEPRAGALRTLLPAIIGIALIVVVIVWVTQTPEPVREALPEPDEAEVVPGAEPGATTGTTTQTAAQQKPAKTRKKPRAKPAKRDKDQVLEKYIRVDE